MGGSANGAQASPKSQAVPHKRGEETQQTYWCQLSLAKQESSFECRSYLHL